jgi:hypothetical protein
MGRGLGHDLLGTAVITTGTNAAACRRFVHLRNRRVCHQRRTLVYGKRTRPNSARRASNGTVHQERIRKGGGALDVTRATRVSHRQRKKITKTPTTWLSDLLGGYWPTEIELARELFGQIGQQRLSLIPQRLNCSREVSCTQAAGCPRRSLPLTLSRAKRAPWRVYDPPFPFFVDSTGSILSPCY